MKFLLVPLLILGMFVSFTAAMMGMLFFTETVESPDELASMVEGRWDATELSEEFLDPKDRLGHLAALMDEHRARYQGQLDTVSSARDSLAALTASVTALRVELMSELGRRQQADSTRVRIMREQVAQLAPYYDNMKPAAVSEILEEGTVPDTTVALLLESLQPQQTAKVMSSMSAGFAARIMVILQGL